jgi:hypothetical protein
MANFTLTSSDEIATPDLVAQTVVTTGETPSNGVANKAGILLRIFNSIFEWRRKQADRHIADFLTRSGGRLTGNLEREMTQRLLSGDWSYRQ